MRLHLILLASFSLGSSAWAGPHGSVRMDTYHDGWMEVFLPTVSAGYEDENFGVDAQYAADLLSGATQVMVTDTVTSATSYSETRQAIDFSAELHLPSKPWSLSARYGYGTERDYRSHTAGLGVAFDALQSMSTPSVNYTFIYEDVGRSRSESFSEIRTIHQVDFSWAQIVDKRTTLTGIATLNVNQCGEQYGCLSNVYRYIPVLEDANVVASMPERNPDLLVRGAMGLRLSRLFGNNTALHTSYRFYLDSWEVFGNTLDTTVVQSAFDQRLMVSLRVRGSQQSSASFYSDAYSVAGDGSGLPVYRSGDRELAGFYSVLLGGRVQWTFYGVGPFDSLSINARATGVYYRYLEFSEIPERWVSIFGGGMEFKL